MNKIDKNVIGVISLCEGMIKTMEDYTTAKTPLSMMAKAQAATDVVCLLLPVPTEAERFQIARRIKAFESAMLANKTHFAVTVVSMLIALVEDVLCQKSPQPTVAAALDDLNRKLIRLCSYWDRKQSNWDCYAKASTLVVAWDKA